MKTQLTIDVTLEWDTEPADQGGSDDRGNTETLSSVRYISAVKRTIGEVDYDITHLLTPSDIEQLEEENG